MNWVLGLACSLGIGWLVTHQFLIRLRRKFDVEKPDEGKAVPSWLTGLVERLFFTIAIAFHISGVPVAMVAWVSIKMATHWNRINTESVPDGRFLVFSGLLAGMVSMFFAMIGGLIIRC